MTRENKRLNQTKGIKTQMDKPSRTAAAYCAEIGDIADCNSRYTAGISRKIAVTGKKIDELTVKELLEMHLSYRAWFNNLPVQQGGE